MGEMLLRRTSLNYELREEMGRGSRRGKGNEEKEGYS